MDIILAIIITILVFLLIQLRNRFNFTFLRWLRKYEYQMGSKLMVAFLAGFMVFVLFTDRVPHPGQKIPIIITALLLIWANLFLTMGRSEEAVDNEEEGTKANN